MARRLSLFGLLTLALASPTTTETTMLDAGACGENITVSETPPTKAAVMEAWTAFLGADPGSVKLLAFDGTILEQNRKEVSLRRSLSPLHLHRGAVMKYVSASSWQTFSEEPLEPWGIVQIEGMIEGTMADHEGPHLLTANLHNMFVKVAWNATCGTYTICMVTAGYVKNLMTDENYVRWGQDVEALLAGAAVTGLVQQLYRLAEKLPGWGYCPELTSDKGELSGFGYS